MAKADKQQAQTDESSTTAVAVQTSGALAVDRPTWLKDGQKRGSENVTHKDMVIPRLEIVQSLSPCRKKDKPEYIEGAEEGMMYNSVTRELYPDTIQLVPCFFLKEWLIWKDRKKGGGFRGAFPTEEAAKHAIAQLDGDDDPADFEALDTNQHFCLLILPTGKVQQIVVSCSKSKMKISRKWNSLIQLSEDDSWAKAYNMSVVSETNKNNEDYYNFKPVVPAGYVNEHIYKAGEALYELLKAGGASADRSGLEVDDVPVADRGAASSKSEEF